MQTFIEERILPVAVKIGNQRHLLAIRDTFIGMIAITMIGAFATLFNHLGDVQGFGWWANFWSGIFGKNYTLLGGNIWWATFAFMALFVCIGVSHKLAKSYGDSGFEVMFIALACFLILIPQTANVSVAQNTGSNVSSIIDGLSKAFSVTTNDKGIVSVAGSNWGLVSWNYVNTTAIFTALIAAILSTELFVRLSRVKHLVIKMPESVPPEVSRAFAKLIPGMLTIITFGAVDICIQKWGTHQAFNDWLQKVLVSPLTNSADTLAFALIVVFLIHFFWFFGLHGTNILLGITSPIVTTLLATNVTLWNEHATTGYTTLAGSFLDVFVFLGGAGTTLGLVIAMLIFSRKKRKALLALTGPTGLFEINEPMIFGFPLVLNFTMLVPFILTPLICTVISFFAVKWGFVHAIVAQVPWPTPPGLGAFIATGGDWKAILIVAINIVISVIIYTPFLLIANKQEEKMAKEENFSMVD